LGDPGSGLAGHLNKLLASVAGFLAPRTDRVKIPVGGGNQHFAGTVAVDVGRDRIAKLASQ